VEEISLISLSNSNSSQKLSNSHDMLKWEVYSTVRYIPYGTAKALFLYPETPSFDFGNFGLGYSLVRSTVASIDLCNKINLSRPCLQLINGHFNQFYNIGIKLTGLKRFKA